MNSRIADIRKDYALLRLDVADVSQSPLTQFTRWFEEALHAEVNEPNAMHLGTVDADSRPDGRIVLLKDADLRGFSFYTNYESRKGQELAVHPFAALTFFWPELERQVRARGHIERVSPAESDTYFASRPRGSQIGAWASAQSTVIRDRRVLDDSQAFFEEKFRDKPVSRPPHWGGFRLVPDYVEFWQGRPSRLHDRIAYTLQEGGEWLIERLSP